MWWMEGMKPSRQEQEGAEWRPPTGRWQATDGRAMLEALAASGQTPSAFARAKGLGPYRVSYWRAKLDERGGALDRAGDGGFVAVAVHDEAPVDAGGTERRVEVTLRNGRVVTFAGTWDAAAIGPWLHALDGAR
jgi:hypothetical protein